MSCSMSYSSETASFSERIEHHFCECQRCQSIESFYFVLVPAASSWSDSAPDPAKCTEN